MIIREIDWRSPMSAFAPLADAPFAALFHPGERAPARWSTIAAFPVSTLEMRCGEAYVDDRHTGGAGLETLHKVLGARSFRSRRISLPGIGSPPAFLSGLCGFVGYEFGAMLEPTANGPCSPFALPDMAFGAYDALAHFDRIEKRAFISACAEKAADRLADAFGRADAGARALPALGAPSSNFTGAAYKRAVADVVSLIRDGVLFQANISQQIIVEAVEEIPPLSLFAAIAKGDAPFAALLSYQDGAIISNSPERFFKIEGKRIVSEPIKGTRARARNEQEDKKTAAALVADPKERAENIMIADLIRNDLSRICEDRSIREETICALESYADVHHLVSRISGRLRNDIGAADALEALFPCGSVTGAPKIEAMKTIAAIERAGRGPYCGAIGYIDDSGDADFAVAIRLLIMSPDKKRVTVPVGGGVTLRSDPTEEYAETLVKARSALSALGAGDAR